MLLFYENLQKLKDQISEQLEKDYESISKSDLKRKLMDGLDEKLKFDLPPTLVSDEADIIWNNYKRDIESSGKKIEDVDVSFHLYEAAKQLIDSIDVKVGYDRSEQFARQFIPVAIEFAILGLGFSSVEEAMEYLSEE